MASLRQVNYYYSVLLLLLRGAPLRHGRGTRGASRQRPERCCSGTLLACKRMDDAGWLPHSDTEDERPSACAVGIRGTTRYKRYYVDLATTFAGNRDLVEIRVRRQPWMCDNRDLLGGGGMQWLSSMPFQVLTPAHPSTGLAAALAELDQPHQSIFRKKQGRPGNGKGAHLAM